MNKPASAVSAASHQPTYPDLTRVDAPALERLISDAVQAQKHAWEKIAADPAEPTFENTILPLEQAQVDFEAMAGTYYTFQSALADPSIQELGEKWAAPLAEHYGALAQHERLVARVRAVPSEGLEDQQGHVLSEWIKGLESAGAFLPPEAKQKVAELDLQLATLSAKFSNTLIQGAQQAAYITTDPSDLRGLNETQLAKAAADARSAGHEGAFLLGQDLFSAPSLLSSLEDPRVRAAYYANSINRGRAELRDPGSAATPLNLDLAAQMAHLRLERAQLFGAESHAELSLRTTVAGSAERALGMLEELVPKALANFSRELDVMAEVTGVPRERITAADVPYLMDQVARSKYAVDSAALRPYFELERVLHQGVFASAAALYGISFRELQGLPVQHPQVRVWEVSDADGSPLGLFAADLFARPTKQGGAWMHELLPHNPLTGAKPIVMNTLNLSAPTGEEPVLLSLDNVRTLFHEFGHALHSLLTDVRFPSVAGTRVPRDFVEYPSQVNEMWMLHPQVLPDYARHLETGEPLPQEAVQSLREAEQWGQGFATAEYLGAALLDLAWHTRTAQDEPITTGEEALAFERAVLEKYGFEALPVAPRYLTGMFKHIFDGGYAAGYYSYLFSEMMDAETVAWFERNGGLTRENGMFFRERLLSTGNRQDPAQSFRDFLGRDPEQGPLLARRGLDS